MNPAFASLIVFVSVASAFGPAAAQIRTDATLGRTPRPLPGPDYDIGRELGRQAGRNLFHSFETFSLADGETATFSAPDEAGIERVISRVTGGDRSDIDGTIRSTIAGADFYFINPAGVVFGRHASIDVQGSFHVSTADELRFPADQVFSATHPTSSLTVAAPEAFGFFGRGAKGITVNGAELLVAPEETLSLVGGDVVIDGGGLIALRDDEAQNGNVTLVAMSRPGEVRVADGHPSAEPRGEILIASGDIDTSSAAGGGIVRIRAGALRLDGAGVLSWNLDGEPGMSTALIDIDADRVSVRNSAEISSVTLREGDAGPVVIQAGEIELRSGGRLYTQTEAEGDAAAVTVAARHVILDDGQIFSATVAEGDAGPVTIDAHELEIRSRGLIASDTFDQGDAGRVTVEAGHLTIDATGAGPEDLTGISSSVFIPAGASPADVTGNAGIVRVQAQDVTIVDGDIGSNSYGAGNAGRVVVTADRIAVAAGGQIGSGTLQQSTGRGGNVEVTARQRLAISGQSATQTDPDTGRPVPSGIFASTESESTAARRAGNATVTARVITIADHGEISSESFNASDAGGLTVTAAERLVLDAGEISTEATGTGAAGTIVVNAARLELHNGGRIHSDSAAAGGGTIDVRVSDTIVLRDSEISTSVEGGTDSTAGDITIDPEVLVIDRSKIKADARTGAGGNIDIHADNVLVPGGDVAALIAREDISASGATEEVNGTISINAPEVDLAAGLVVLEGAIVDTAPLRARCGARRDIGASSFTGVGRAGLPPSPDGPLASSWGGAEPAPAAAAGAPTGAAAGWLLPCAPRS